MGMHLGAAQLLNVDKRTFATIELAGVGSVRIASFSALAALEYRRLLKLQEKGQDVEFELMRALVKESIVDDAGASIFDDASARTFLSRLSPGLIGDLSSAVTKLNGAKDATAPEGGGNPSSPSPSAA